MRVRVIISALMLSLHFVDSTVLEYPDQEENHREFMIDQPQKVNRGEKILFLKKLTILINSNLFGNWNIAIGFFFM